MKKEHSEKINRIIFTHYAKKTDKFTVARKPKKRIKLGDLPQLSFDFETSNKGTDP